jgi:hypothetical protein
MNLSTISLSTLYDRMPLLADLRPDLLPDKIQATMLQAAIRFAEMSGVLERTYEFDLQCCTGEYLLDEFDERIVKITQLCLKNSTECSGKEPFKMANQQWCAIPGCGGARARFVPSRNILEVTPVSGLSGILRVSATVAPDYDAQEIDEVFASMYRNALFHETAAAIMLFAGEFNSQAMSAHHARMAKQEYARIVTNKHTGYSNTTKIVKGPRLV